MPTLIGGPWDSVYASVVEYAIVRYIVLVGVLYMCEGFYSSGIGV